MAYKCLATRRWINDCFCPIHAPANEARKAQARHSAEERFWARVDLTPSCWLWTGYVKSCGYGEFWANDRKILVHRFAYELLVGPIPEGLHLDHLCRVRECCNPAHLEPVTNKENARRGIAGVVAAARNRAKTHCPYGHPYDETNTLIWNGGRVCRECKLSANRQRYAANKVVKPPRPPRTHCAHGHPFDEKNTGRYKNGHRYCRECKRLQMRERRAMGIA